MNDPHIGNLLEVPVARLRLGMFVAQLDRPWLETPFAIQGFYVRTLDDVLALQKYCEYVYVDFTAPRLDDEDRRPAAPPPPSLLRRLRRWLRGRSGTRAVALGTGYRDLVDFDDELPRARVALDSATDTVRGAMAHIAGGRSPDVPELTEAMDLVVGSLLRNRDAISALVRMRHADDYTFHHALATGIWAVLLGRHLGIEEQGLAQLGLGGSLLDLGKAGLPRELLVSGERYGDDDRRRMRDHVALGLDVLGSVDLPDRVRRMIATHHERHDGSGYPAGLTDTAIPVFGRIAGIADSYDAMISRRPWAPPRSSFAAMRELQKLAGTGFQREMVEQFMQAIGSFPSGTLVELNTGEVAVVVAENRARRLKPKVMLLLDADKRVRDRHLIIDLYEPALDESTAGGTWIVHGLEAGAYALDAERYFL